MDDHGISALAGDTSETRLERTISSMVWSAWADALGFISELTDERGLRRRTNNVPLTDPIAWKRRVGGKFGVQADLPAGCYSDDTQLRLSTARSISGHGFDVEAFARVELTLWPAYALGGGRASKAAAAAMTKTSATWYTNFFTGWKDAGGNGAAMRIQPHVWASRDLDGFGHLEEVICNSVTTHGHPRALVGAALHATALAHALTEGQVPGPDSWGGILQTVHSGSAVFERNPELASYWRPRWEMESGLSLTAAWDETVAECARMLSDSLPIFNRLVSCSGDVLSDDAAQAYHQLADSLGLTDAATRGSGTATVVAALLLAAAFPDHPADSARLAARAVGTDTDTIATMASAVVGAATPTPSPATLVDETYLREEATRLVRVGLGHSAAVFPYPDLLRWTPPQSQLDSTGLADGRPALAGLGWLEPLAESVHGQDAAWTWMRTSFGPSVLVKHRLDLKELQQENWPQLRNRQTEEAAALDGRDRDDQRNRYLQSRGSKDAVPATHIPAPYPDEADGPSGVPLVNFERRTQGHSGPTKRGESSIDVDQVLKWVAEQHYDESSLGYALRRIAESGTVEQLAVFVACVRPSIRKLRQ
ncbi:ADP-ribosylglycohydrolase family protein [Arthrobacter sp. NPDC058130]|uniref:ADP-ribosylglycohydrolase family protein n=1 Tax=Arthrobacter sp. NPDC058130 TaxID=3346353 RepID=UPI0036E8B595